MSNKKVILRMPKVLESLEHGAKSIADFRLRIADWNIGLATCCKSAIRNLQSEILFNPMPRN